MVASDLHREPVPARGAGCLHAPVDQDRLPAGLLERFARSGAERLLALLRFLAAIIGGAAAVHAS